VRLTSQEWLLARKWRQLKGDLAVQSEDAVPSAELSVQMSQGSVFSFSFFLMLALAAAIATLGLIANSAPAIIGAMIIAPLMTPIMSLSYGLATFERQLIIRSLLTVFAGTILVVALGCLITLVFGLRITGSEILNRTAPTVIDLGVALAAGAAAAFANTRRSILSSIAGVAIAVALVPPLAVSGIGLALRGKATAEAGLSLSEIGLYSGGTDIALGAFILFLTNFIGIVAVAILVFVFQRYGDHKKAVIALFICGVFVAALAFPLQQGLHRLYAKNRVVRLIHKLPDERPDIVSGKTKIDSLSVTYRDDLLHVHINSVIPKDLLAGKSATTYLQERIDLFQDYLATDLGEAVLVEFDAIIAETVHVSGKDTELGTARELSDQQSGSKSKQ
jgi:uncharacterized hydrophobic protein (TIGR00271 family)